MVPSLKYSSYRRPSSLCKLCELTAPFGPPSLRHRLRHEIRRPSHRTPPQIPLLTTRSSIFRTEAKSSHREENRSSGLTNQKRLNSSQVLEWCSLDTNEAERGLKTANRCCWRRFLSIRVFLSRGNFFWSGSLCFLSVGNQAACLVW